MYLVYCLSFIFNSCDIQEPFYIWFERSGGFAGISTSVEIDSKTLSAEEAGELEQLIEQSGFFDFIKKDTIPTQELGQGPDQFQYEITIEYKGGEKKTVELNESTIPDSLRPLVNYLTQKARFRKK